MGELSHTATQEQDANWIDAKAPPRHKPAAMGGTMRQFGAAALLLIVGCQTAPPAPPRDVIPPPFAASGATVTFSDERHDWEKHAVNGPTTIYRLGRVTPNPWSQLAKETEAIVAAMPEKPHRVDVFVTSFRLVRKEDKPSIHDPSDNVTIGKQSVAALNSRQNAASYQQLQLASQNRDQQATDAAGKNLLFANGSPAIAVQGGKPEDPEDAPGSLGEHPPGASCRVRATVRLTFADGREKLVDVKAIAAGQNTTGTQYYGEALDFAAKMAVRQYGNQMRAGLGLPQE
jgi:hypothetical protein